MDARQDEACSTWGLSNLRLKSALLRVKRKCSMYASLNQPEIDSYGQRKLHANQTGSSNECCDLFGILGIW